MGLEIYFSFLSFWHQSMFVLRVLCSCLESIVPEPQTGSSYSYSALNGEHCNKLLSPPSLAAQSGLNRTSLWQKSETLSKGLSYDQALPLPEARASPGFYHTNRELGYMLLFTVVSLSSVAWLVQVRTVLLNACGWKSPKNFLNPQTPIQ